MLMQTALATPGLISLAAGFVDAVSLPLDLVGQAVADVLADPVEGRRALQYGSTPGDVRLRRRLLAQVEQDEGVPAGTWESLLPRTVITSGSQQLLYLVSEILLDPGDIVLVESPTYFVYLGVLESRGARAVGVATDDGGLRLDALEATLKDLDARGELDRVKLIYTVSEHSNPTGISLAAERRGPLVEIARRWSRRRRILILEDAAYRGLCFEGTEPPSVWRHDHDGDTVILARTLSKTLSPGLRVGFGILPEPYAGAVLKLKGNHDFGSANFNQVVAETLMADGSYDRHVERLRGVYRRKRDVLLGALEEQFEDLRGLVSWTHPRGGLYVWMTVPDGLDTGPSGPLFPRCLEEGVIYVPGAHAFAETPGPVPTNGMRLCFGTPSEAELVEGTRRLATALVACLIPWRESDSAGQNEVGEEQSALLPHGRI
jgi:2-aminoadipate transaminase